MIFPITLKAREALHGADSPYDYRGAFHDARDRHAPKITWYAYDVIVLSRSLIEFVVYDMRDSLSGGIGKEVARFTAKVSPKLTKPDIDRAIWNAADVKRDAELADQERAIVAKYAEEIRMRLDEAISPPVTP